MKTFSVRVNLRALGMVVLALTISACSSSGEDSAAQKSIELNDSETGDKAAVMYALYNNVRTPDGFYHEDVPHDGFYTISHVKNTDLLQPVDRSGMAVYELSTDDFSQALDWSETAAGYQAGYKSLVDNTQTDFYLQFTRVDPVAPDLVHLSRVFKQSVLDRSGVDRNADGAYQGRVELAALNSNRLKTLMEYLWVFSFSNNYGNAVLGSSITEYAEEYRHTLREAKLIIGTGGDCDRIDVYETLYETDKATGMIWKTKRLADSFLASNDGGALSVCADDEDED